MKTTITLIAAATVLAVAFPAQAQPKAQWWLTTADQTALMSPQRDVAFSPPSTAGDPVIIVDDTKTYQTVDGFGFALTGGSADHLIAMTPSTRHKLLEELFGTRKGDVDISYLRISVGASDLNDHVFSYDDIPDGQTDVDLDHFTLAEDDKNVVPILKEILAIDKHIKILASPWSAPVWMKTNGKAKDGTLKDEDYAVYARYLVRYIQEMKKRGIDIDALTPQNEPNNPHNTPSMVLTSEQELKFVKEDLGPAFAAANVDTKIIVYDHNCDRPDYPMTILADPAAAKYVDGSGFHLYGGTIDALSTVHNAYPDKNVYFTEQMVISIRSFKPAEPVSRVLIGAMRNWSRNVLLWNLAADSNFEPHTDDGGCPFCQGAVTIDGDKVDRNVAYYAVAHFSRFVPPGSLRIDSTATDALPNVAFRTPDGKIVDVVANPTKSPESFDIAYHGNTIHAAIDPDAVATFVW